MINSRAGCGPLAASLTLYTESSGSNLEQSQELTTVVKCCRGAALRGRLNHAAPRPAPCKFKWQNKQVRNAQQPICMASRGRHGSAPGALIAQTKLAFISIFGEGASDLRDTYPAVVPT